MGSEDIEIVDVAELIVEALETNGAPVATAGDAGTDAAPADD